MFRLFFLVWALSFLFVVPPSWARSKETDLQAARRIYVEGARFFLKKRYQEAEVQFLLAYRLVPPSPRFEGTRRKLLYFLGVCQYHLKKYEKSHRSLTRYLKGSSSKKVTRKTRHARRLLAQIKKIFASRPRRPPPRRPLKVVRRLPPRLPPERKRPASRRVAVIPRPATRPRPQPPRGKGPLRAWPFVVMAVGLAALAGGGVTGGLSLYNTNKRDQVHAALLEDTEPHAYEVGWLDQQARLLAMTANILYIAGGAITATGLILVLAVGRAPPPPPSSPQREQSRWMPAPLLGTVLPPGP